MDARHTGAVSGVQRVKITISRAREPTDHQSLSPRRCGARRDIRTGIESESASVIRCVYARIKMSTRRSTVAVMEFAIPLIVADNIDNARYYATRQRVPLERAYVTLPLPAPPLLATHPYARA